MLSARHDPASHPVIELDEVIDYDNETAAGRILDGLIADSGSPVLVVDLTAPLVTSATLHVLIRARQRADALGVVLCVVARRPSARRVFRLTGLYRALRVSATPAGAAALCRGCLVQADEPDRTRGSVRARGHVRRAAADAAPAPYPPQPPTPRISRPAPATG